MRKKIEKYHEAKNDADDEAEYEGGENRANISFPLEVEIEEFF